MTQLRKEEDEREEVMGKQRMIQMVLEDAKITYSKKMFLRNCPRQTQDWYSKTAKTKES